MAPTGPDGCRNVGRFWNGQTETTARLTLRPPAEADADAVAALLNDPEVAGAGATLPYPCERGHALEFVARAGAEIRAGRGIVLLLHERLGGRLVGCVGAGIEAATAEVGFWIGRDFWGRGYATEAVRRLLRLLFRARGVGMAWATARPGNLASRRVLGKCGFMRDGVRASPAASAGGEALDVFVLDREVWESAPRPMLLVAAVALVDADGRVLLTRRPPGKDMAGMWEFPGGKLKEGETPEAAVIREAAEELGIDLSVGCLAPIAFASHDYDSFHLLMPLYVSRQWEGTVAAREGQELAWVRPLRMADYVMPPADVPLVALLRDWL